MNRFIKNQIRRVSSQLRRAGESPGVGVNNGRRSSVWIETHGCQMNVSDSEIVRSLLDSARFEMATDPAASDVILINTCAIRDKAERKIWNRLSEIRHQHRQTKVVGVLGCMAQRIKDELVSRPANRKSAKPMAELVVGPDEYRLLPSLIADLLQEKQEVENRKTSSSKTHTATTLSHSETYEDIVPIRAFDSMSRPLTKSPVSAFVTIMRGCNNMCSFCVVPRTRGRERSLPASAIVDEVQRLVNQGVREVVLLGQNVNSYNDLSNEAVVEDKEKDIAEGFKNLARRPRTGLDFADLLNLVAQVDGDRQRLRVRFTSPHPKDFSANVLHAVAEHPSICNQLHLPAQSGNSEVLDRMRRNYIREAYLQLVDRARSVIGPDVALSSDFIVGFPGETEAQFQDTLSLVREVGFDQAFMFAYSERPQTRAARKFPDDVSELEKNRRLQLLIQTFHETANERKQRWMGRQLLVLVEGPSKKHPDRQLTGKTDHNVRVNFDRVPVVRADDSSLSSPSVPQPGDYVLVEIVPPPDQQSSSVFNLSLIGVPLKIYNSILF